MDHVITSGDVLTVFGVVVAGVVVLGLFALALSVMGSGWDH